MSTTDIATGRSLKEPLLSRLTQALPSDVLALCADGKERPDLIVVDPLYGLVAIDIDTATSDPTAREPFQRLNQKIADLRLEVPAVEHFRPHRLVLFSNYPGELISSMRNGTSRALGLADLEQGRWLKCLEPRPPEHANLEALRSALAPTLIFNARFRRGTTDPGRKDRRKQQVALDAQQATAATMPVSGTLMLSGPPGSGKTLVLAGRAKHMAALHPDWRIALLCFNNALVPYLGSLVDGYPNVAVTTFGKFAYAMGHRISLDDINQADADLSAARANGIIPVLDALLIDEAQDFHDAWIEFALATVRPARGGTLIAGDERQAVYLDTSKSRVHIGHQIEHLRLKRSYRSTHQILEAACTTQQDPELLGAYNAMDGEPVELIWAPTWDEQAAATAWEIRRMIDRGERAPGDIAVLVTQRQGTLRRLRTALERVEVPYLIIDRNNAKSFDPASPDVKLMTVHSAKGYEFDVVVLFGLEALPSPAGDDVERDREATRRSNVGFVGMTRARDLLLVTYTRDNPHLDRLRRCPGVRSSIWPDDFEVENG